MASNLLARIVAEEGDSQGENKKRTAFLIRAIYGEFCCTLIFFSCVFSSIANTTQLGYAAFESNLVVSLTACFAAIAMIFCYSGVSGANFNCAISFSLWLTGKLSNRKLALYWFVQAVGSLLALALLALVFDPSPELWNSFKLDNGGLDSAELARVFAKEFIATFILTYVVFHVAFEDAEAERASSSVKTHSSGGVTVYTTAPNSKGAFTPFVFGFLLFGLLNINGAAMNPLRVLAPAVVCSLTSAGSDWSAAWVYVLGELTGAAVAGFVVHSIERLHRSGGVGEGYSDENGGSTGGVRMPLLVNEAK